MAASRSSTARPTWSMAVNTVRSIAPARRAGRRSRLRLGCPPMRVALVVNEASGGGTDPAPLERAMREHGAEVSTYGCEPEDLARIADPERIVVAGGDGTVGAVAELAGRLGVPLGVVPAGTANDFVRANGLPLEPVDAAVVAVTG